MLDMNPQVREVWVEALRSGEYPQAEHYLHVAVGQQIGSKATPGFCCLGVLCDLAVKAGIIPPPRKHETAEGTLVWIYGDHDDEDDESYTSLPDSVANWAGIPGETDPTIAYRGQDAHGNSLGEVRRPASDLNDNQQLTFEQIADAIVTVLP